MIACFGDSITEGKPGVSYCKYFTNKKDYKNFGLGGDTVTGMTKRAADFLTKSSCNRFIIEIGTNDILLPFLSNYSPAWKQTVPRIIAGGKIPMTTISDFTLAYEKLIRLLSGKQITVVNIPCIGEDTESGVNKKVDEYNQAIQELCGKNQLTYIDFNRLQKELIKKDSSGNGYFISKNPFGMMSDSFTTTRLGLSERISKKRNLITTVDGVHLNPYGARALAKMIENSKK